MWPTANRVPSRLQCTQCRSNRCFPDLIEGRPCEFARPHIGLVPIGQFEKPLMQAGGTWIATETRSLSSFPPLIQFCSLRRAMC